MKQIAGYTDEDRAIWEARAFDPVARRMVAYASIEQHQISATLPEIAGHWLASGICRDANGNPLSVARMVRNRIEGLADNATSRDVY